MRFLKDLLFTDTYLIKGHASTGNQRLSTFLNSTQRHFLEMEEATLIRHEGGEPARADWMLVRVNDILFAHEMEQTGDEILKQLAEKERDEMKVTLHFNGNKSLRLSGKVRRRAFDPAGPGGHDFIVVLEPGLSGHDAQETSEYAILEALPYAIVNRNRVAFVFQRF
jgi:hypothetical protein